MWNCRAAGQGVQCVIAKGCCAKDGEVASPSPSREDNKGGPGNQ